MATLDLWPLGRGGGLAAQPVPPGHRWQRPSRPCRRGKQSRTERGARRLGGGCGQTLAEGVV
eukprot:11631572-Alexandrium_andersonii.AAC.1